MATAVLVMTLSACGSESGSDEPVDAGPASPAANCADVVAVQVGEAADGTFRFEVTVHSDDTGWDAYADRWEVRDADGTTLAVRPLTHPHVDTQPFTRSLTGIRLSPRVTVVELAAHHSAGGFCGKTLTVDVSS